MKPKKYLVRYTARPLPGFAQAEVKAENAQQAIIEASALRDLEFKSDKPHDQDWWDKAQPTAVEI